MQLHQLSRVHKNKISRQVGRGGRRGKTSGRGTKGQNARSGHKKRPELRDIIKTIPKLRGRGRNIFKGFQEPFVPVNLDLIEICYSAGEEVNPESLIAKGVIESFAGKVPKVKILADGEITIKVSVVGCMVSKTAQVKIEKAGGTVKMMEEKVVVKNPGKAGKVPEVSKTAPVKTEKVEVKVAKKPKVAKSEKSEKTPKVAKEK